MFIFVLVLFVGGVLRPFLAEKLPASHLTVFLLIHFCSARTFTLTSFFSRLHRSYMNYVRTHYVTDEHIVRKMHRWKWCFSCIHEWNWTHFKKIARVLLSVCVRKCAFLCVQRLTLGTQFFFFTLGHFINHNNWIFWFQFFFFAHCFIFFIIIFIPYLLANLLLSYPELLSKKFKVYFTSFSTM